MPEKQAKERARLTGFLAKFLDPATTESEAVGAVTALVIRLRGQHKIGERFFWLALVTAEEKAKLEAYRARRGEAPEASAPTAASAVPGGAATPAGPKKSVRETIETVMPFAAKHFPSVARVAPIAADLAGIAEGLGAFSFFDRPPAATQPSTPPGKGKDDEEL